MKKNQKIFFGLAGFMVPILIFALGLAFVEYDTNFTLMGIVAVSAIQGIYYFSLGPESRAAVKQIFVSTLKYYFGNKEQYNEAVAFNSKPLIIKEDVTSATKWFMWGMISFFLSFIILFFVLPLVVVLISNWNQI